MHFTIEDYEKIERWLKENSVKDTEFPETSDLYPNEYLTIIQQGINKKVKLNSLLKFILNSTDSDLDIASTNPVQNQAVTKAIYELQNRKIIEIVDTLPSIEVAKSSVIYILLAEVGEGNNIFTEWIKVNNTWEKVGEFKAEIDLSPYLKIQDAPFEKGEAENSAVLKGGNNKVTNANEVALGEYNESNNDTRFSIGVGTSDTDRRNAIEVKENGDVYITGIGGYNDDNFNKAKTLKSVIDNKIDKIEGKDLSSNDFTNALKEKLEGLENYDDAEISSAVEKLSRDFNALLGNNASAAIESFNEIIAFLEGIEDSASLDAIVASIQQEIAKVSNGLADTDAKLIKLSERVEENEVLIEDLQNTKIDKEADDYYPQLSVGLADNLAGQDVVDSEISFRRSGGGAISDGVARIEAIKGNSVVWNQKVRSAIDSNGELGWWRRYSMDDIELSGNKVTIKPNQVPLGVSQQITQNVNFIANHKYLVIVDYAAPEETICRSLEIHQQGDKNGSTAKRITSISNPIKGHSESFHTAVADMPYLSIYFFEPTTFVSADIEAQVIDLTQMFGAGNEPTTIEEFNARKPLGIDENAYNEGEVIHMNAQSLESVGVNQWDEEWEVGEWSIATGNPVVDNMTIRSKNFIPIIGGKTYKGVCAAGNNIGIVFYDANYKHIGGQINTVTAPTNAAYAKIFAGGSYGAIYNYDICFYLSDASINGKYYPYVKRTEDLSIIRKYFPDGMKSTDTDSDAIRYNKVTNSWEKVVAIKSIKLKDLSWVYVPDAGYFFSNSIDARKGNADGSNISCISEKYLPMNWPNFVLNYTSAKQKSVALYTNQSGAVRVNICDTEFTDVASFLASLTDEDVLYYSAKESIVTEIEDDFNLDYEVWNGGTEKIVSDVPTTPLKADIAYGFNAYGKIQENSKKIEELEKNKIVVDSSLDANSDNPISNQLFTNSFNYLGTAIKDVRDDVEALGTEVSNKEDKPIEIVMNGEPADTYGTDTGVTYYLNKTNIGLSENDSYTEYYQKVLAGNVLLSTGSDYQSPVNKYVHEDYVTFNIASQFTESGIANGSITIHSSPQTSPNGAEYYVEVRIWFTANNGGGSITVDSALSNTSTNPVQNKVITSQLTELSAEVSGLSERIDNLSTAESSVFEAVYGETTYEEIAEADRLGKLVICKKDTIHYILTTLRSDGAFFSSEELNYYYRIVCSKVNVWTNVFSNRSHELKTLNNGNAQITIAGKTAEVVTPQNVGKQGVIRQTQTWTQAADKGYDYVMQDIVRGSIPSYFIDLWKSRGGNTAAFNEETGYFEFESLKDISYEEATAIYARAVPVYQAYRFANHEQGRAILPQVCNGGANGSISLNTTFTRCGTFECIGMNDLDGHGTIVSAINTAFYDCTKLKVISGTMSPKNVATLGDNIFNNCYSLEEVRLKQIKASIGFAASSRLSKDSVLYMIQNAQASPDITIKLHSDVYDRLEGDADIVAALAEKTNVSLASA